MEWVYGELVAVSLAAMLSPTTLTFSVLALVLGDRPLRTGIFFYIGVLTATLAVGVRCGDRARRRCGVGDAVGGRDVVAILDVIAASFLLVVGGGYGATRRVLRSRRPQSSRWARSPRHLRSQSWVPAPLSPTPAPSTDRPEDDLGDRPEHCGYAVQWLFFALVSLLPLLVAIVLLLRRAGLGRPRARRRPGLAHTSRDSDRDRDRRSAGCGAAP